MFRPCFILTSLSIFSSPVLGYSHVINSFIDNITRAHQHVSIYLLIMLHAHTNHPFLLRGRLGASSPGRFVPTPSAPARQRLLRNSGHGTRLSLSSTFVSSTLLASFSSSSLDALPLSSASFAPDSAPVSCYVSNHLTISPHLTPSTLSVSLP